MGSGTKKAPSAASASGDFTSGNFCLRTDASLVNTGKDTLTKS